MSAYELMKNVLVPNPLGFIVLKMHSYQNDPGGRGKDFADILQLITGLVEKGTHFKIKKDLKNFFQMPEAKWLKKNLIEIHEEHSRWDMDQIKREMLSRNFSETFLEETLPERVLDFIGILSEI